MKKDKTLIAFLAVCFFWGSTYLAIKIGIASFPPFMFAGTRFVIAGLLMLSYGRFKGYTLPTDIKEAAKMAIVGILLLTGGNGLVTLAERSVASGIASLMVAMVPIYIAIIEVIILRRIRLSLKGVLGMGLGFVGVYMLVGPSGESTTLGFVMLLLAGMLWSIGSVFSQSITKASHIVINIGIQMLTGGLMLLVLSLLTREQIPDHIVLNGILALIYLILFGSIVGYSSYIYVLKHWPASKAGTYAYVNPVVAVCLGFIILSEPIHLKSAFAMTLILVSVYLVRHAKIAKM